jgi:3-oxoacyl-[acyl-carrier protein] reductase
MAKSWATENAAFGITSNCISPSFMQTNLTGDTDSRLIENMIADNPNKSLLKEDEVAEAVNFLVNATPQINGSNIIINAAKDLI